MLKKTLAGLLFLAAAILPCRAAYDSSDGWPSDDSTLSSANNASPDTVDQQNDDEEESDLPSGNPAPVSSVAVSSAPVSPAPRPVSAVPSTPYYESEAMIVPSYWAENVDGVIMGDKERRLLISEGDTVYVKVRTPRLKPGTRGTLYRTVAKIRGEDEDQIELRRVGKIEVTRNTDGQFLTAKVIVSYEPIEHGDMIIVAGDK